MEGSDPRSQAIHEGRNREDVRREHALDALKRKEVFVSVDEKELEARLVDLYRNARTTMQEGGANTLDGPGVSELDQGQGWSKTPRSTHPAAGDVEPQKRALRLYAGHAR